MADQSVKERIDSLNVNNSQLLYGLLNTLQQNHVQIIQQTRNSAIETIENFSSLKEETNKNNIPTTSAISEECDKKQSSNIEKKSSNQNQLSDCYLQNKISEDELFHKTVARKFAELEVQRKQLEIERLQWEFEKEKYQNEILWNYEIRMMYYKEQKAKRLARPNI